MRKKSFKWISVFAAAALLMTGAAPALAQDNEPVPEFVQEAAPRR